MIVKEEIPFLENSLFSGKRTRSKPIYTGWSVQKIRLYFKTPTPPLFEQHRANNQFICKSPCLPSTFVRQVSVSLLFSSRESINRTSYCDKDFCDIYPAGSCSVFRFCHRVRHCLSLSLSLDDGWRQPQVRNQSTELSVSSSQQIVLYVRHISFHPLLLLHIILSAQNRFSLSLSIRPCKTSCIVLIGLSSSSLVSKSIPTAAGVCGVMELTVNRIPP